MGTGTALRQADDEAALVARVAAGDRGEPVVRLYRRYHGRLYGLGLRLLGDPSLAEELVQETFLRLWRTAGRYDPERAAVGAYVFAVARTVAADLRRRPSSRPLAGEPGEEALAVGDGAERVVRRLVVRDAVDGLSPAHRQVIELTHYRGLSQREIADTLGVPLGTVKTRVFHALRSLRSTLRCLELSA